LWVRGDRPGPGKLFEEQRNVDLDARRISGKICEDVHGRRGSTRSIAVTLGPRIIYHSHVAEKWGLPGNAATASSFFLGAACETRVTCTTVRRSTRKSRRCGAL
jgi:hypothetical protein